MDGHGGAACEVAGPLARIQVADQAARLRPRWSLGAYCGPGRNNMLSRSTVSQPATSRRTCLQRPAAHSCEAPSTDPSGGLGNPAQKLLALLYDSLSDGT